MVSIATGIKAVTKTVNSNKNITKCLQKSKKKKTSNTLSISALTPLKDFMTSFHNRSLLRTCNFSCFDTKLSSEV